MECAVLSCSRMRGHRTRLVNAGFSDMHPLWWRSLEGPTPGTRRKRETEPWATRSGFCRVRGRSLSDPHLSQRKRGKACSLRSHWATPRPATGGFTYARRLGPCPPLDRYRGPGSASNTPIIERHHQLVSYVVMTHCRELVPRLDGGVSPLGEGRLSHAVGTWLSLDPPICDLNEHRFT